MAIQGNLPGIVALLEQDPNLVSLQVGDLEEMYIIVTTDQRLFFLPYTEN